MRTKKQKQKYKNRNTCYNELPEKVSRKNFNLFVKPFLEVPNRGPRPKLSLFKIFNYILFVLHTGTQWDRLVTYRNEIHWSNIYKWHKRWSENGSYEALFEASVNNLRSFGKLDLSIIFADGSNTTAKKGVKKLAIADTSIKEARKRLL
jgi:transposase